MNRWSTVHYGKMAITEGEMMKGRFSDTEIGVLVGEVEARKPIFQSSSYAGAAQVRTGIMQHYSELSVSSHQTDSFTPLQSDRDLIMGLMKIWM